MRLDYSHMWSLVEPFVTDEWQTQTQIVKVSRLGPAAVQASLLWAMGGKLVESKTVISTKDACKRRIYAYRKKQCAG